MANTLARLEARLNRLEADLIKLRHAAGVKEALPWYEQILGTFRNDRGFEEMVRLGKEIRDSDHGLTTRRPMKRKATTSVSSKKGRR